MSIGFLAKLTHRIRILEEAMGAFNLTNLLGSEIKVKKCEINQEKIAATQVKIKYPNTLIASYNGKKWNEFSGFILDIEFNGNEYHINLNKDHYFYGGEYHYPGEGSDIDIILFGTNTSGTQIQLRLAYCKNSGDLLIASDDYKYMDKT